VIILAEWNFHGMPSTQIRRRLDPSVANLLHNCVGQQDDEYEQQAAVALAYYIF
jgi:hypothetical protein